ncbi:MAG: hypothetical protein HQL69_01900 [Magnetococcales bacterium]|nr:hypothetical protein [Magnetococcales bacterium]
MKKSPFFTVNKALFTIILSILLWSGTQWANAERVSDVRRTKHNLSNTDYSGGPTRTVKAATEDQVCIFCHTPHGASLATGVNSPLWNREFSTANYSGTYESTSIDANIAELQAGPGGTSKLCLSCHDGTLAIGSVNVLGGEDPVSITMNGTGTGGVMPDGSSGASSGFTRNLGIDLSNDHPISFTYDSALATADGELRTPPYSSGGDLIMGNRVSGVNPKPILPLEDHKVQCSSCHDPHLRDASETASIKFLRLNRFQKANPAGSTFSPANDIICLACHDKGKSDWATSVHANSTDANETYKSGVGEAAEIREFPNNIQVWEASCLNCHDTHTVTGSRRLLREGTDSTSSPKLGGNSAIEETCYQCHRNVTDTDNVLVNDVNNDVPDIRTDFTTAGYKHMPITTGDQPTLGTEEKHDIINADFQETALSIGKGNLDNRHVECTDCHNPHRVMKNQKFNATGASTSATHLHSSTTMHTNIASGALRGTWGVEPVYATTNWLDKPSSYVEKKGDGGASASTARSANHVTREYQICLRCHSDFAYNDNGTYPTGNRPNLGDSGGGTSAANGNDITQFTNQAMEFAADANDSGTGADQGEPGGNHRSWHPVIWPTGRSLAVRGGMGNYWLAPWNGSNSNIGDQTMYCSDCHGSATANGTSTPNAGKPWGPHGSSKNFILKGDWDQGTGIGAQGDLCFKCHNYTRYATDSAGKSGFCCEKDDNLHGYHAKKISNIRCTRCHVAVPHGWKNKALLVNLNDVGAEAGQPEGTKVGSANSKYTKGPYYLNAALRILNWRSSGNWLENDCGWGTGNRGVEWMKDTCS